jgi:hypothetical protein
MTVAKFLMLLYIYCQANHLQSPAVRCSDSTVVLVVPVTCESRVYGILCDCHVYVKQRVCIQALLIQLVY